MNYGLVKEEHASNFIVEAAKKYGNDLNLICLGPLTNIAVSLALFPKLVDNVGQIFIMGGALTTFGNTVHGVTEFNF